MGEGEESFGLEVGEQFGECVAGFEAVEPGEAFGQEFQHEGVAADGGADLPDEVFLGGLQFGVVLSEQSQGFGFRQSLNAVAFGLLKFGDARGEQQVEIADTAELEVVLSEIVHLVGVVNDEEAGAVEVGQRGEQQWQFLVGVHGRLELQTERPGEQQERVGDVFFAQHPGHVSVFVPELVVITGRQRGFAHAAIAVDEQEEMAAGREQFVMDRLQVAFPADEDIGLEGVFREGAGDFAVAGIVVVRVAKMGGVDASNVINLPRFLGQGLLGFSAFDVQGAPVHLDLLGVSLAQPIVEILEQQRRVGGRRLQFLQLLVNFHFLDRPAFLHLLPKNGPKFRYLCADINIRGYIGVLDF